MSLDVSLYVRNMATCPHCNTTFTVGDCIEVYDANITHNLISMADEAGIYRHVWRPEEIGVTRAGQLIVALRDGIAKMESDPEKFMRFDAENGWGKYRDFLPWLREYLVACERYPDAEIEVSR